MDNIKAKNCVYRFISPSSRSYIGIAKDFHNRLNTHRGSIRYGKKTAFYDACRKYGLENFKVEILTEDIHHRENLKTLEIEYIDVYNSYNDSYNMTLGGDGVQLFGKDNGMYGRTHTDEVKKKLSQLATARNKGHTHNKGRISVYDSNGKRFKVASNDSRLGTELKPKELVKYTKKSQEELEESYERMVKKRKETFSKKSKQEIEDINKRKSRPGVDNGRSTFYVLEKEGIYNIVSLKRGLEQFCNINCVAMHPLIKSANTGHAVKHPPSQDNKYRSDSEYKIARDNATGYTINKYRRIKL